MGATRISKNFNIDEVKGGFWVKTKNIEEINYMFEKWLSLYGNTKVCIGTVMTNNASVEDLLDGELKDIEDLAGISFGSLIESANLGRGNFQFLNKKQRKEQVVKYTESYNTYNPGSLTKDLKSVSLVEKYDITNGNADVEEICIGFKDFDKAFLHFTE